MLGTVTPSGRETVNITKLASDRHGNLDIFLMPAEGGRARDD